MYLITFEDVLCNIVELVVLTSFDIQLLSVGVTDFIKGT